MSIFIIKIYNLLFNLQSTEFYTYNWYKTNHKTAHDIRKIHKGLAHSNEQRRKMKDKCLAHPTFIFSMKWDFPDIGANWYLSVCHSTFYYYIACLSFEERESYNSVTVVLTCVCKINNPLRFTLIMIRTKISKQLDMMLVFPCLCIELLRAWSSFFTEKVWVCTPNSKHVTLIVLM